ncbi:cytochrome P450, partial [[Kitasatospora] papulosa]
VFDPDRWDASNGNELPPRHAMVAFGSGARKCIGDKFAIIEAVITLATIAARWKLEPVPNVKVRPALGSVMTPRRRWPPRRAATARSRREDPPVTAAATSGWPRRCTSISGHGPRRRWTGRPRPGTCPRPC